ncbi:cell division control protein, partial [Oleoguttula sp. CCFEE 5521]
LSTPLTASAARPFANEHTAVSLSDHLPPDQYQRQNGFSRVSPQQAHRTGSVFPKSHVGFDSITQQIKKKLVKRGFQFNVICVGQTGLGKSTLINTIFASNLVKSKGRLCPAEPIRQTTEIQAVTHVIEESGVRLRLSIVDTPGYGDLVNNDRCWDPIVKDIEDQHSAYLRKELTAQRERYIQDTRIHCRLYFISPSGHALRPIDIVWCSDNLDNVKFGADKQGFSAKGVTMEISEDGASYRIKGNVNKSCIVDITFKRSTEGFVAGKDGTTSFRTDPKKP